MNRNETLDDETWQLEFLLRLRLTNVPAQRIGDVLKTVREHCMDSGESDADAFGDPRAYAVRWV